MHVSFSALRKYPYHTGTYKRSERKVCYPSTSTLSSATGSESKMLSVYTFAVLLAVCCLGALARSDTQISRALPLTLRREVVKRFSQQGSFGTCTANDVLQYFEGESQDCYNDALVLYEDELQPLVNESAIPTDVEQFDAARDFCKKCSVRFESYLDRDCGSIGRDSRRDIVRRACSGGPGDHFCAELLFDPSLGSTVPNLLEACDTACSEQCVENLKEINDQVGCCLQLAFSLDRINDNLWSICNVEVPEECNNWFEEDYGECSAKEALDYLQDLPPDQNCHFAVITLNPDFQLLVPASEIPELNQPDAVKVVCEKCAAGLLDFLENDCSSSGNHGSIVDLIRSTCGKGPDGRFCLEYNAEPVQEACQQGCSDECTEKLEEFIDEVGCCFQFLLNGRNDWGSCNIEIPEICERPDSCDDGNGVAGVRSAATLIWASLFLLLALVI